MINLVDCEVPAEFLLGEEGMGLRVAFSTLDAGRIGIAAQSVGIARGALEEARAYAKTRKAFGEALASFQAIRLCWPTWPPKSTPRVCSPCAPRP
jgi:butyryl-CoA dehydrogenase